jgi:hypothetical protein
MPQEPGDRGPRSDGADAGRLTPLTPPDPRPRPSRTPPPRPEMSDRTPPPIRRPVEPSTAVKASRFLWTASFIAGLMAVFFGFLARNNQTDRIQDLILEVDPDRDAETLETAANIVLWTSLGALVVVVLIELALLFSMLKRRGYVRWIQLLVLAAHAGVTVVADALIVGDDVDGIVLRVILVSQLFLALAGLLASFLPGTRAWFRSKD